MMITTPAADEHQKDEEMLVPHLEQQVEGSQPMEVAQPEPEPAATAESQQAEDPPTGKFTWTIDNFTRLNTKKRYSDVFSVGSCKWRLLVFPKGDDVDYFSMYLEIADSASLPYGWSRLTQFRLAVVNQMNKNNSVGKGTQHQFNARQSYSEVSVLKAVNYWANWTDDSIKETGYVGLKNQGATCYLNSVIQFLYHIPYFRKAVYDMPTAENNIPSGNTPLALQRLFYNLQYSDTSIATKELTESLGWLADDSFIENDVHEFNRVLCEKLEDEMKGTVVEGTIKKLFEGHVMTSIELINVNCCSTNIASFYDLQLDVKNCTDVYASFDKFVEVELLEGDNKYHSEKFGLQDAKKNVLFVDFPPVLQLQLKRFDYDKMLGSAFKINDRYEYPLQLDLDRGNRKYLSPAANRSVRNLYTLHR